MIEEKGKGAGVAVSLSGLTAGHWALEKRQNVGREQKEKWSSQTPRCQGSLLQFWLSPLAGGTCWVHRGRRSSARKQLGVGQELGMGLPATHEDGPEEGSLKWPCEPVRPLKSSVLHSPLYRTSGKLAIAPLLARAASWQTCRWLALATAKITFPGKCFHLLKRTLRKYCIQQISNFLKADESFRQWTSMLIISWSDNQSF